MWARLLPINRNIGQRALTFVVNGNVRTSVPYQRYKHSVAGEAMKEKSVESKRSENYEPIRSEATKAPLLATNDPNEFGAMDRRVIDEADLIPDAGDIADDEHYHNIPGRRDQLPQLRYEQMIKAHIRDRRLKEAIDVLEVRMKDDRVKPNYYIYELLILECGRLGYARKAFNLYNTMKKRGLRVSNPIYVGLFSACANNTVYPAHALKLAENLRKILIQMGWNANELIYNAMIKAFGRCGDFTTAFQLVDEMKEKKLRLKIDTINHLLHVCCSDKEYGFRHALHVWHKMYRRKLVPDVHSFNLMVRCSRDCSIGDVEEMRRVIATILSNSKASVKLKANRQKEILFIEDKPSQPINATPQDSNIIESDETNSNVNLETEADTKEVCDQMPNFITKLPHLGSIVQLSMVKTANDRFMLLGGLDAFIAELEETKVRPDTKTFSLLLDVIESTTDAENDLIQKMRYMRVRADTDFFNLLMKRRILRKDYDGAKQVIEMLDVMNLKPNIATYGIMAMGCVNREQANQFQKELSEKGIRLNNEILGALLKNASFTNDFEYVIDLLKYAMEENLKPSAKFMQILGNFKNKQYHLMQKNTNNPVMYKYNAFYAFYKQWKKQMGLLGLSSDETIKLLNEHPWYQFKETEGDGIEIVKNKKTRRMWKQQHALIKLTPQRIERLAGQNAIDDPNKSEKPIEIDDK